MKVGDKIKCADVDDLLDTMKALALEGIDTDFYYDTNGICFFGGNEN